MRPPEFTGGNPELRLRLATTTLYTGFNEAAGIHRRKLRDDEVGTDAKAVGAASMRPPEFTGGNRGRDTDAASETFATLQ